MNMRVNNNAPTRASTVPTDENEAEKDPEGGSGKDKPQAALPDSRVMVELARYLEGRQPKADDTIKDNDDTSTHDKVKPDTNNKPDTSVGDSPKPDGSKDNFEKSAEQNGWKPLGENQEFPPLSAIDPKRQSDDVITYELGRGSDTYAVSKEVSPFKFSQLESKLEGKGIEQTDDNVKIDLPKSEATDFMRAKTTDGDKPVSEVFNATMKDEWKDLDPSDNRREYYDLLQAKSVLTGGMKYLPNQTVPHAFHSDKTNFSDPTIMDTASLYGLLDEEAIGKRLGELAEDPEVVKGVDGFMDDAVGKIKDKGGLTDKIYDAMMSGEYKEVLKEDKEGAQTRFQNDLMSLTHLDAEKADEVRNHLIVGEGTQALNDMIENGTYSDESLQLAASDQVTTVLKGVWTSLFGTSYTNTTLQNALKGDVENLPKAMQHQLKGFKESHDLITKSLVDSTKAGTVDGQPNMKDVMKRVGEGMKNGNISGSAAVGLNYAVKSGAVQGAGGVLAASAAAYSMNKNGQDTLEERMAAARMMMVTAVSTQPLAHVTTTAVGKALNKPGMSAQLGFDNGIEPYTNLLKEKVPDAFEKPGKPPTSAIESIELTNFGPQAEDWAKDIQETHNAIRGEGNAGHTASEPSRESLFERASGPNPYGIEGGRETMPGIDEVMQEPNERIAEVQKKLVDEQGAAIGKEIKNLPPGQQAAAQAMMNKQAEALGADPKGSDGAKLKYVGGTLGVAGTLASATGGSLDIALGGMAIDKLRKGGAGSESAAQYASASLQLVAGVASIGSAGTGLAGSIIGGAGVGAGLGVASGVLGLVGAGIGAIGLAISGAVAKEKNEKANKDTQDFFDNMDGHGMTEDGWHEKLNYLQHTQHEYDFDSRRVRSAFSASKPVWESQPEQFKDFTEQVKSDGNIPTGWFKDWSKDHPDNKLANIARPELRDPSGRNRFGDKEIPEANKTTKNVNPGTLKDFKDDIDRVDVASIELLEDGRVGFTKDGTEQVVDPLFGVKSDRDTREGIADHLTRLHDLARPDGEFDPELAKQMDSILGGTDDYNEIDDLHKFLTPPAPESQEEVPDDQELPEFAPTLLNGGGTAGDFKEDIDKVDVASIRRDEDNDNIIQFKKDGSWQRLDRDNTVDTGTGRKVFDYLVGLHDIVRPNGQFDEDLAARIDNTFARGDDHNDLDKLKELLNSPSRPDAEAIDLDGTFGDFKEDIDRVDIASIQLREHGRVEFRKDGALQLIDPNVGGKQNEEAARYLTELHALANPDWKFDEDRAAAMNDLLGRNDDYNDIEDLKEEVV